MSGIFRNITLWSAPTAHSRDFSVKTPLDAQYRDALLEITAKVKNYGSQTAAANKIQMELFGPDDKAMRGVFATADVPALPCMDEQMNATEYSVNLPPSDATVFSLSTRTLGAGSAGCGPRPLDQYIIWSDPATFSYVMRILPAGNSDLSTLGRQPAPQNRTKPAADAMSHQ